MQIEKEVAVGVQTSLLITDEQFVPIDTFKPDNLCLEAIQFVNLTIERQPQISATCGQGCYSATSDVNEPATKRFSSNEHLQAADTNEDRSG